MGQSFDLAFVLGAQHVMVSAPWTIQLAVFFARWLVLAEASVAVSMLFFRNPAKRHAAVEAAWASGLALIVTSIISHIVLRPRPFLGAPTVVLLIPPPLNTSFTSGHTAVAVAIACAIATGSRTAGYLAVVMAAFIAFGRISVGVHYPTDILGGMFVGLLSFGLVRLVHGALLRKDIERSASRHHHS